jgi:hypothetical protein
MDRLVDGAVSIAVAIVGVALLAVLVSKNAQTPAVFASAGNAFSNALRAATGPVTGGSSLGGVSTMDYAGYGLNG